MVVASLSKSYNFFINGSQLEIVLQSQVNQLLFATTLLPSSSVVVGHQREERNSAIFPLQGERVDPLAVVLLTVRENEAVRYPALRGAATLVEVYLGEQFDDLVDLGQVGLAVAI